MFRNQTDVIVGLEIGTSKICAVVAEVGENGVPTIVGVGQSRSYGVRKSEIIDQDKVENDIRIAISEAEQMSDQEVSAVYLAVTGSHVKSFMNRGFHPIHTASRVITQSDVEEVVRNAKTASIPPDNMIIHSIRQNFIVDQKAEVINPIDMIGTKLEVDVLVVHGIRSRIETPVSLLKNRFQIKVNDIVFNGLASSLAVLTNEQKEIGTLVIDLGAGTTNYVAIIDGLIKHCGVLAVGGDHISNDIAIGLKIPLGRAESLKIKYGSAIIRDDVKGKYITINNEVGLPSKSISLENLYLIMNARVKEILELVCREVAKHGILEWLRGGVVLCGGGARIPGIVELSESVFSLPTTIGYPTTISGISSSLKQPEFVTPIGLIKYATIAHRRHIGKSAEKFSFTSLIKNFLDAFS
ncbi:MAG: cell division protein FtsA [Verrucomicrobiia bacterium]|jgi:cell division protein FtsA